MLSDTELAVLAMKRQFGWSFGTTPSERLSANELFARLSINRLEADSILHRLVRQGVIVGNGSISAEALLELNGRTPADFIAAAQPDSDDCFISNAPF